PGLAILLVIWPRRREPIPVRASSLLLAAVLFAAIGLSWFVALALRLGPGPLSYFFLRENLERFAGEAYDIGRPPWYYLPTYFVVGLPWSLLLPAALGRALRDETGEARSAVRLLTGWILLALVP